MAKSRRDEDERRDARVLRVAVELREDLGRRAGDLAFDADAARHEEVDPVLGGEDDLGEGGVRRRVEGFRDGGLELGLSDEREDDVAPDAGRYGTGEEEVAGSSERAHDTLTVAAPR